MTDFQPTPQTPEEVADGLRNAFRQAKKDGVMDATPYLKQMTFKSDIEKTEAEIKVLQKKLELLKEIETHKSPVEEAYKDWWGQYPELETDSEYDDMRWQGFQAGFQAAYEEKVREDDYYDEVVDRLIEQHQAQKLWNILKDKWGFSKDACGDIVEAVAEWLPKPQSAAGSQNVNTELLVDGFNHCLEKIKGMLR